MNRVAITGMGLVDTLGNNPDECLTNYLTKIHEPVNGCFFSDYELIQPENIRAPIYASLTKANKMALHSVEQALSTVPQSNNVSVIYSIVSNCTEIRANNTRKVDDGNKLKPREMAQLPDDFLAGLICREHNFEGISTCLSSACATSLYNIDYAIRLLDDGYDYVVVGGTDTATSKYDLAYYAQLGALGTRSSPFDKDRDGFIMGEGAGCLVLESEEKAKKRNAKIFGYIHKVGLSNDAASGNAVAPDPEAKGIKRAMSIVSGYEDKISFVNAHATSTPLGDEIEYNAIRDLIPDAKIVSFKSKLGHTIGASGVVELIYTIKCLENQIVPLNHNIKNCDLDIPTEISESKQKFALKNSMGFGGKNASILVEGN